MGRRKSEETSQMEEKFEDLYRAPLAFGSCVSIQIYALLLHMVLCPPMLSRRVLEISIKLELGCTIGALAQVSGDLHAVWFDGVYALLR